MRKINKYFSVFINLIASLLLLLFLYTGINKLEERELFQVILSKSPFLSSFAGLLSWIIPFIELFVSALLFFPNTRVYGLKFSIVLMAGFTLYIAYMLLSASHLPCSCGGVLKNMSWLEHLVFNIIFLLLSITALRLRKGSKYFIAINRHSRTPV